MLMEKARAYKDADAEFLLRFKEQVEAKDPRYFDEDGNLKAGSLDPRSDLYVGKMRGSADEEFVESSPETATFTWEAAEGPGECVDCAELGKTLANVPADEFYQYPGDGGTECLGNCRCVVVRGDGLRGFEHHDGPGGAILRTWTRKRQQKQSQSPTL